MYVHRNNVQFPTYHLLFVGRVAVVVVVACFCECFVAVASNVISLGGF